MSTIRIRWGTITVLTAAGLVLCATGCGRNQELDALRQQNQLLSERVIELENQLQQTPIPATGSASVSAAVDERPVYIVVQGDSLWHIAEEQLGSGKRYKEILALNPHITQAQSLTIGTMLTLPPR